MQARSRGLPACFETRCESISVLARAATTTEAVNAANLTPNNCLVVEDSLAGIVSAKSAGMWAVGVPNTYTAEELLAAGADDVIVELRNLTPTWIDRRFDQ